MSMSTGDCYGWRAAYWRGAYDTPGLHGRDTGGVECTIGGDGRADVDGDKVGCLTRGPGWRSSRVRAQTAMRGVKRVPLCQRARSASQTPFKLWLSFRRQIVWQRSIVECVVFLVPLWCFVASSPVSSQAPSCPTRARLQRPARLEAFIEDSSERDPRCSCMVHSVPCAPLPLPLALVFSHHTSLTTINNHHRQNINNNHQSTLIYLGPQSPSQLSTINQQPSHLPPPSHNLGNQPCNNSSTHIMSACQQPLARPQPQPQQNVLDVTSDDSISSTSSSSSGRGSMHNIFSSPEIARCSRCHRTPSIDIKTGKSNMVQYGLNQYYCSRCATMVGFFNR